MTEKTPGERFAELVAPLFTSGADLFLTDPDNPEGAAATITDFEGDNA